MGLRDLAQGLMGAGKGLKLAGGAFSPQVFQANVGQEEQLARQQFLREENMARMNFDREQMITGVIINAVQQGAMDPAKGQAMLQKIGVGGLGPTAAAKQTALENAGIEEQRKALAGADAEERRIQAVLDRDAAAVDAGEAEIRQRAQAIQADEPQIQPLPEQRLVPADEQGNPISPSVPVIEEPAVQAGPRNVSGSPQTGLAVTGTPAVYERIRAVSERLIQEGQDRGDATGREMVKRGMTRLKEIDELMQITEPKDAIVRLQRIRAVLPRDSQEWKEINAQINKLNEPSKPLVQIGSLLPEKSLPQGAQDTITGVRQMTTALNLIKKNISKSGLVNGWISRAKAGLGVDRDAQDFLTAVQQLKVQAQAIIKGIPSNFDVQTFIETLPDITAPETVNESRIAYTEEAMRMALKDAISYHKGLGYSLPDYIVEEARGMGVNVEDVAPWRGSGKFDFPNLRKVKPVGEGGTTLEPETVDRTSRGAVEDELRQIEAEIMRRRGK